MGLVFKARILLVRRRPRASKFREERPSVASPPSPWETSMLGVTVVLASLIDEAFILVAVLRSPSEAVAVDSGVVCEMSWLGTSMSASGCAV